MAYINKDHKKIIAASLKEAMKKFPTVKYSLSIRNKMVIVCKITKGPEFLKPPTDRTSESVNTYWLSEHYKDNAQKLDVLTTVLKCLSIGHYDRSDVQTDYFDCAFYRDIEIGVWDKPYEVV